MPSIISHAVAACALGTIGRPMQDMPARFWLAAAVTAALPDADVVAFAFGIPYESLFGHRGLSHSLVIAAAGAAVVVALLFRDEDWRRQRFALWACFFAVIASHGVLDAMTTGGLGVAFFAPFSDRRYFFPWRPILVSPIGIGRFFSSRGAAVLASEMQWVWTPSIVVGGLGWLLRRGRS